MSKDDKFFAFFDMLSSKGKKKVASRESTSSISGVQENFSNPLPDLQEPGARAPQGTGSQEKEIVELDEFKAFYGDFLEREDYLGRVCENSTGGVVYGAFETIDYEDDSKQSERKLEARSIQWLEAVIEDNENQLLILQRHGNFVFKTFPTYEQYKAFFSKSYVEIEKIYKDADKQNRERWQASQKKSSTGENEGYKKSTIAEDRLYKLKYGLRIGRLIDHCPTLELYRYINENALKPCFDDYCKLTQKIFTYCKNTFDKDGLIQENIVQTSFIKYFSNSNRTKNVIEASIYADSAKKIFHREYLCVYYTHQILVSAHCKESRYNEFIEKLHSLNQGRLNFHYYGLKNNYFCNSILSKVHALIERIELIGEKPPPAIIDCKNEIDALLYSSIKRWNREKSIDRDSLEKDIKKLEKKYNLHNMESQGMSPDQYHFYLLRRAPEYPEFRKRFIQDNSTGDMKIRFPLLERIRTQATLILPRKEQEIHTYVIGGTKSGKSELLKFLYVQDMLHSKRNAILLDPHGDISNEIINISFLYPQIAKKIIYIDTAIYKTIGEQANKLPCINPLEINRRYIKTEEDIESIADNLILAFQEIVNAENTVNMSAILKPCLCVLLREDNTTLMDLARFMDDDRNDDLVKLGLKSPNLSHREFFEYGFYSKSRATTKQALSTRLQVALNSSIFVKMTCGKTTVDFYEIMRGKGNFVIFRFDKNNTKAIQKELGILITSTIMSSAFSLDKKERIGTHLFMDEFQNFINRDIENILSECRKYKLYLTMAHQYMSQITDTKLKQGILANTNIKIIGKIGGNAVPFLKNNGENKINQENVDKLRTGKFLIRIASKGPEYNFVKVPSVLVNPKWVNIEAKNQFLFDQYNRYYKPSKTIKREIEPEHTKESSNTLDFNKF